MQFLERQCLSDHATADIIMPDLFYFTRIFLFLAIEYGNAWICIQLFKTLLHMIGQMISTQWTHVDLCLSTVSGIGHVLKPPNVCPDDVYGWGEKGWCEANTTCTCLKSLFASQIVSLSSRHPWNFKKTIIWVCHALCTKPCCIYVTMRQTLGGQKHIETFIFFKSQGSLMDVNGFA